MPDHRITRQSRGENQMRMQKREIIIYRRRRRAVLLTAVLTLVTLSYIFAFRSGSDSRQPAAAQTKAAAVKTRPLIASVGLFPFAKVQGTELTLYLPAAIDDVCGLGYHQSFNRKSYTLLPSAPFLNGGEELKPIVKSQSAAGRPSSFVMTFRGRGSSPTSAVDIALKPGTLFTSPVDGVVADVIPYMLYGRQQDYRVEILADGQSQFKIAIAHTDNVRVVKGDRLVKGLTKIASVRHLPINSQVNDYISGAQDHIHLQINPINADGKTVD